MTRARRAKWVALLFVSALTLASATVGVTQGAFAGQTSEGANIITAMPDFRGPTISAFAIGKSTLGATGFIKPSATYYIYANVTDVGTPPSGTSTVIANVANVTAGQTAVALSGGTWTVGGTTYNCRSAQLTANALPQRFQGHLDRGDGSRGQRDEPERQCGGRQRRPGAERPRRRAAASRVVPRSGTC